MCCERLRTWIAGSGAVWQGSLLCGARRHWWKGAALEHRCDDTQMQQFELTGACEQKAGTFSADAAFSSRACGVVSTVAERRARTASTAAVVRSPAMFRCGGGDLK